MGHLKYFELRSRTKNHSEITQNFAKHHLFFKVFVLDLIKVFVDFGQKVKVQNKDLN